MSNLGMHSVLARVICLYRKKSSRTDVQRHEMPLDPGLVERRE